MRTAQDIISENQNIYEPNVGIKALAKKAFDDPEGFCILDDDSCWTPSYREECLDRCSCHRPDFMLACVATRNSTGIEIGEPAVRIYHEAMEESN